jgi:protein-tyrosine-phosphatase
VESADDLKPGSTGRRWYGAVAPRSPTPTRGWSEELGIDRSGQVPSRLTDDLLRQADVVVALKSGLPLDVPNGIDQRTWDLPNPADWDVDYIRPLLDHIQQKVHELVQQLLGVSRLAGS